MGTRWMVITLDNSCTCFFRSQFSIVSSAFLSTTLYNWFSCQRDPIENSVQIQSSSETELAREDGGGGRQRTMATQNSTISIFETCKWNWLEETELIRSFHQLKVGRKLSQMQLWCIRIQSIQKQLNRQMMTASGPASHFSLPSALTGSIQVENVTRSWLYWVLDFKRSASSSRSCKNNKTTTKQQKREI